MIRSLHRTTSVALAAGLLVAASVWATAAQTGPVVSIRPASLVVATDATSFQVQVFVSEVRAPGLGGYDLYLNFDPAVIQAINVVDSGFVLSTNNIVVCVPPYIDNTIGQAILSCVTVPLFVGPAPTTNSTPHLLATATFRPVATGTSGLSLEGTALHTTEGALLAVDLTLQDGQVTVAPMVAPSPEPEPPTATFTPLPPPPETPAPTATAAVQAPPPASSEPEPTLEPTPTATPSPQPTATPPVRTATPTARPTLPPTGNGPEDGSSWVIPITGGIAGAAAAGLAAALGFRAWRRRQRGSAPAGR